MSSNSRQQLEAWLKTIEVKADMVLDVGGAQLPVKGRTKSWEVKDYKILDLEQPHECKQKPDYEIDLNKDKGELKILNRYTEEWTLEEFNIAFCLEVAEYWWNPVVALQIINHLLKPGGVLYISFHFLYPKHNPVKNDYLRYTEAGAIKLLKEAGFIIDEIEHKQMKPDSRAFYHAFLQAEGMKAAKDCNHDESGYLIKAIKV